MIWDPKSGRLDFNALSRRIVAGRRIAAVAAAHPAHFVAFDLLAADGEDLRDLPLADRRRRLERLMSGLAAPLTLCEQTADAQVAQRWLDTLHAGGVEGLVVKDAASVYPRREGQRVWWKRKVRTDLDLVVVATVGDPTAPTALLLARATADGLVPAGATVTLAKARAREIGRLLTVDETAVPRGVGWPARELADARLTGVLPMVAEVSADVALDGGVLRHPARLVRLRPDLEPGDLSGPSVRAPARIFRLHLIRLHHDRYRPREGVTGAFNSVD